MTTNSSLASVAATQRRLAELGLSTKKSFGQHFLVDDGIVGKILRLAAPTASERIVEVGPGIGTLTEALLGAQVELLSIELDLSLLAGLQERYPTLCLLGGDALDAQILASVRCFTPVALVANLPYAVAATILLEYFTQLPSLASATVMVQREVAERIAAKPGSKAYGAYTIKLQFHARVAGHFTVSPQCFFPPPRVDSAVVRLERQTLPAIETCVIAQASLLADAAFFQRRKTIRNSMQAYFAAHAPAALEPEYLLEAAGIDPKTRGETLLPKDFLAMAALLPAALPAS